jgi:hypothetical protein
MPPPEPATLRHAAPRLPVFSQEQGRLRVVYVALALNPDGEKDVLGLWIEQTEGAKFWLKVVNELKARAEMFGQLRPKRALDQRLL